MRPDDPAMKVLLDVYHKRNDLQENFPEVKEGEFQLLINWAAGASTGRWIDADRNLLLPFSSWYVKNEREFFRPIPQKLMVEILEFTSMPMLHTVDHLIKNTDVAEHLVTLYMIVIELGLKKILELGVRTGESSVALIEAAEKIGGHVWSMDIDDCLEAKNRIASYGLSKYWTFLKGDDRKIGENWTEKIDLIYVDTIHTYSHVISELRIFEPFLAENGIICFHDTRSFPEVLRAVRDFVRDRKGKYRFYNYVNCNGLTILRMIS